MNTENIVSLSKTLERLGFKGLGHQLLKRLCFKPSNFTILHKITKGDDAFDCHLFFEKGNALDSYAFVYFDASLCKETVASEIEVNGIEVSKLEKQMTSINWSEFFISKVYPDFDITNKATWQLEATIWSIINNLTALENTKDGIAIASTLKIKYWQGLPVQEWTGQPINIKSKEAIIQRFYVFNAETDICLEEAYRFLKNSWWEKEMRKKREQPKNNGKSKIIKLPNEKEILHRTSNIKKRK